MASTLAPTSSNFATSADKSPPISFLFSFFILLPARSTSPLFSPSPSPSSPSSLLSFSRRRPSDIAASDRHHRLHLRPSHRNDGRRPRERGEAGGHEAKPKAARGWMGAEAPPRLWLRPLPLRHGRRQPPRLLPLRRRPEPKELESRELQMPPTRPPRTARSSDRHGAPRPRPTASRGVRRRPEPKP